jgi:TATA-box binding protein (TBP) (component of TFIID and TFIIIB)
MSRYDTYEFKDFLDIKNKEIKNLPQGVGISTMCASFKLDTKIDVPNIKKFLPLCADDIHTVKINNEEIRTLRPPKVKPKRTRKETKVVKKDVSKNAFYNQVTVVIRISHGPTDDLGEEPSINLKLFKNGSVQMSGCKSITSVNTVLNKLIVRLKEVKARFEDGRITEKTFIEEPDKITVKDFKIDMINSNYQVSIQIDRDKLYNLLQKKKIKSSYEPCIRACVIIKYVPEVENKELKEVSVFVFQKGNIIITGARSKSHIMSAYDYMNDILLTHKDEIIKKDEKEEEDLILSLYKGIESDINIGLLNI